MRRFLVGIVAILVLLTPAGCGASVFPTRPVDLPVDKLDPCAAFDAAQKMSLRLRKEGASRATVDGLPSVGCIWLTSSDLDYGVQTFPIAAEDALPAPGAFAIQVNGFGAVRNATRGPTSGGAPNCKVTIDAGPGAAIRVQVRGGDDRSDEEMCRLATEAASMVMTTVVKNSG